MFCVLCVIKEPMIRMQLRWKPVMVKQDYICYDFVRGFTRWQVILCSSADNFLVHNKRSLTA